MKKPLQQAIIAASVVAAAVIVFIGTQYIASNYLDEQSTDEARTEVDCKQKGRTYHVVIQNNSVVPQTTYASLCDVLTVTNEDDKMRKMAFGVHDRHQTYDGQTEDMLARGESTSVVLNKAGTYKFHDHYDYRVQGTFTVKE